MVPEDFSVSKALNQKGAVVYTHPKSNAARAYKEIAAKLLNIEYDSNKDREKMIKRLLQRLGLQS
jgi:MinD-like ATPase involved in chromosome partitioning or flagellar assembly